MINYLMKFHFLVDEDGRGVRCHVNLLPQTHKKKTHLHVKLTGTSTECWQKKLNLQKGQETLDITE